MEVLVEDIGSPTLVVVATDDEVKDNISEEVHKNHGIGDYNCYSCEPLRKKLTKKRKKK